MAKKWILMGLSFVMSCNSEVTLRVDGCRSCHETDGRGIEVAHAQYALDCVDCHGGDNTAQIKNEAHVNHAGPKNIRTLAPIELDQVDPDYLRFVNPSDYRVVNRGCGNQNTHAGAAGGCHQDIIERSTRSVHATLSGQTLIPRFNAGLQDNRLAVYGPRAVSGVAPDVVGPKPADVVDVIEVLPAPPDLNGKGPQDMVDFHTASITKGCPNCHLYNFGGGSPNIGTYRSSGCAACHILYDESGLSQSDDPVIDRSYPAHPLKHEIVSAIPDKQCETCHFRGNRVGPAYKGWTERPGKSRDTNADTSARNEQPRHSRPAGYWIFDPDTRNDIDETPPDIHYAKGLGCIDCHLARDVHGDGWIHSTMDLEMGIECVDCHGDFSKPIIEREGQFLTSAGDVLKHVRRDNGRLVMRSLVTGKDHPLTQIVALRPNPDLLAAHAPNNHGEMECYTCHTAWSMNCYGCHTTLDLRASSTSPVHGGAATLGRVSGSQDVVTTENLHLGINSDGKIGVLMVQTLFQSVVVACDPATSTATCTENLDTVSPGRKLIASQVRRSVEGKLGFSWGPAVPHTTADKLTVQRCDRCHPLEGDANLAQVRVTYGFGDGRYVFTDGAGVRYDLTRAIDENGVPEVAFAHPPGPNLPVGPIPIARIRKALAVKVR